jgi:antitoxin HicB
MLAYPVTLQNDPKTKQIIVSFIDFPNVHSVGEDEEAALLEAVDALETGIEMLMDDRQVIPMPSAQQDDQHLVVLPALVTAKVLLYTEMLNQKVRKSDMCKRMGIHMQQIDRLLDIRYSSKMELVEQAIRILGKQLNIELY